MFLAIKELLYYKKKYLLVTTILILLLFMVLFLSGLANGLSSATSSAIQNSDATYYVISDDADMLITRSNITEAQYQEINKMDKLETPTAEDNIVPINLQRTTIKKGNEDTKIDCTYLAIDPNSFMKVSITEGDNIKNNEKEIILNDSFKDEGIKLGDIIVDAQTNIELKVVGFTHNESYGHSYLGIINLQTYQEIRKETTNNNIISYHSIAIKSGNIDGIKNIKGIEVLSKSQIISNIPGHSQEQMTINMILIVLLIISAIILGVFFYVITIQKLSQFGTLKAIGTSMSKLTSMIIWQVFIIAGFSVLIGDLLTLLMASILPNKMPFTLSMNSVFMISIAFILISILSSLFTLIKVAKVDPIIAIGGGE